MNPHLFRLAVTAAALVPAVWPAEKKPVTLEVAATRRADAPATLTWAPHGKRFLLVDKKDLVLVEGATGARTVLTSLEQIEGKAKQRAEAKPFGWQNRRVAAGRPEWSEDEKTLLVASGGDLFLFDLAGRQWTQLTETVEAEEDAHLSPDGTQVGFRKGSDLYVLTVASRKLRRLTADGSETLLNGKLDWVYPEELSLGRAWWWSPDSKSIAFLQFDVSPEHVHPHVDSAPIEAVYEPQRFPKAGTPNANVRLGVVAAGGGRVRWMEAGPTVETLLARVDWAPDSRHVAVVRLSRVQDHLELLSFDAGSGRGTRLLEERDSAWVNLTDGPRFLSGGRFLWSSEREGGFRHLWLHEADGRVVRRLTNGPWEVSAVAAVGAEAVYFTGTKESPVERQLYRVALAGGEVERVSQGAGTHTVSMSPAADFYADTFSNLTSPPERTLRSADGRQIAVLQPANRKVLDEYALQPVEMVNFSAEGQTFYGQIIKPVGFVPGKKYPAIVMVYGGPHAQTVKDAWADANWEQALAARGFVIWRMDNRGSGGRGHAWEAPLHLQFGKTELADQLAGVKYLVGLGYVDPARIGIYGWSYGGYMTLYSLFNAPSTFAAGVAGAPVTDWRHYDTIYTERYMGLPSRNEMGYRESSAVTHAGKLTGKLMLVHNFQDDNVLFQNSQHLIDALQKADKPFEMMFYQQKTHGVTGPARKHLLETTTSFFERALRPGS